MKILVGVMLVCSGVSLMTVFSQAGIMGDVNGDGDVDTDDAVLVLQNTRGSIEFTPEQKASADVSGDGRITAYDAALILRYAAGFIDAFPAEDGEQESSDGFHAQDAIDATVSAPNTSAPAGSTIAIPINITDTTGLDPPDGIIAVEITLSYDSSILTATGISTDGTITSGWMTYHEITSGQIEISMAGVTALSGAGTLIKVIFSVSSSASVGSTSPLALSEVELNDYTPATTDGLFTVASSGAVSITIIGPNGGEMIKGGITRNITWTFTGTGIHHVHLQYSINSGDTYQDITVNTPNDNTYEWDVPYLDYNTMRVKAIAEDSYYSELASDASNSDFTIDSTKPVTEIDLSGEPGENDWWTSDVIVSLSSTGDLSGIKWTWYKINDDSWEVYSSPFDVTGSTVYYYSEDKAGNVEDEKSVQIEIDKTAPSQPVVTDDGDTTADGNQLHASWSSSDPESGIVEYHYAIGTAQGDTDVVDWTSVGTDIQVTKTGLNLIVGQTYYFSVEARNEAGLLSAGYSDGITYEAPQINIDPTSLTFNAVAGEANPDDQILNIANSGYGTLNWNAGDDAGWLSLFPTSGSSTGEWDEVTVSVVITGLPSGTHLANITITATGASNTPQIVSVTLNIADPLAITLFTPNGGEAIKGGDAHEITWVDTEPGVDHIRLQYSSNSGATYQDIVDNTPNDGSYIWDPVPELNSSAVRVKAIAEDIGDSELSSDVSDSNFIIDSTEPVTVIQDLSGTQGADGWWITNVEVTLYATDSLSGVKRTRYRINSGPWYEYSGPFTVTGSHVYYYSEDNAGNLETEKSVEIKIDKTLPSTPVVTDDGDETPSTTQLHASWASEDAESCIAEYRYAIGMTPGGTDVVGWTSVGASVEDTATGLSLTDGETYYFSIEAKNGAGRWSSAGFSDGITVNVNMGKEDEQVYLYPGWNFFSICLNVEDNDILSVLEPIEGYYISIWTYDAFSGTWRRHVPDGPPELNDLYTIEAGKGYLIYMKAGSGIPDPALLTYSGWPITNTAVQLYQGWNVAGYKSRTSQSRQNALQSIAGKYTHVSTYDGSWLRHDVDLPESLSNLSNLKPGYGYYIYMEEGWEWTLP